MNKTTFLKTLVIGAGMMGSMVMAPATFAGNSCSEYRLSAYGGDAGFRVMSGSRDFRKASNGSVIGNICQSGNVQIELSKRNPGTHVSLAVNGREYVFGQGDRGDRHVNNWFRRYININLGHYAKPHNKPHKWKGKDHSGSDYGHNNHAYGHNKGHYNDKYVDRGYQGRDHDGYNQNHNSRGAYYDNDSYEPEYYGNRRYSHSHGHKAYRHHKLPRFAVHSKRHRKAHRHDIPHRHKRHHGQRYVTYH